MGVIYPPRLPLWIREAAERLPATERGAAIGFAAVGYLAGFEDGRACAASGVDFANVPAQPAAPPRKDDTP